MDLIAQVVAAVLTFLASIIGNIFAHDICASADSVCAKIIRAAVDRLATFDQESREQEWLVDLREHQTVFEKYRHAVGCYLAAPKMKRCAVQALFKEAPGLVWKQSPKAGKNVWQARWQSSPEAIGKGYHIKSVKLLTGCESGLIDLTSEEREFIIGTALALQAELDEWMLDHINGRHD